VYACKFSSLSRGRQQLLLAQSPVSLDLHDQPYRCAAYWMRFFVHPQVAIVQAGGRAFSTVPLNATQWAVCLGFGSLTLVARQLLRLVPTEPPAAPPPASGGGQGPQTFPAAHSRSSSSSSQYAASSCWAAGSLHCC